MKSVERVCEFVLWCRTNAIWGVWSLEHIILLALVRLENKAYGMAVRRESEARTGRDISISSLPSLERLETKGYVRSQLVSTSFCRRLSVKR